MPLVGCESESNYPFGFKCWLNELLLLRLQVPDDDVVTRRIHDGGVGNDMQIILDVTPQAPDMPAKGSDMLIAMSSASKYRGKASDAAHLGLMLADAAISEVTQSLSRLSGSAKTLRPWTSLGLDKCDLPHTVMNDIGRTSSLPGRRQVAQI